MYAFPLLGVALGAALFFLAPAQAQFFRGTPMPDRPGCHQTHCQQIWDEDLQLPFRRCYWRCPRPRQAPPVREYVPEPPSYHYEPPAKDVPQYEAAPAIPVPPEVLLIGLIALVVGLLAAVFSSSSATRHIDTIDADIAKTAELAAKLEAASREADAHLAAFLKDGGRFDGDQDCG